MAQKIISGAGSINRLAGFRKEKQAGNIFLVTGKKSFTESGAEGAINEIISGSALKRIWRVLEFQIKILNLSSKRDLTPGG